MYIMALYWLVKRIDSELSLPEEYHCNYCDTRHEGSCPPHGW